MEIVIVRGSEQSSRWEKKVSGILAQISQRTRDHTQWLDIEQAWDALREKGSRWDMAIVEFPDATLSENPDEWENPSWILTNWSSPSYGAFAVSAAHRARVLVCSYIDMPKNIKEKLERNEVSAVRLDELSNLDLERLRRASRTGRVPTVLPTIDWLKVYHSEVLPDQFKIPEDISFLMNDEVQNTRIQSEILAAAFKIFGVDDLPSVETLFVAMQTARHLATLEIEGEPYESTLAVGKQEAMPENLIEPNYRPTIGLQRSTLPEIEEICELGQGSDTCIGIDGHTGLITGIFRSSPCGNLGRISQMKSTAVNLNVLLLHLPGNGTVELVGPNGVICEYDGSQWEWWRFRDLYKILQNFVTDSKGLNVLFEALDHLSFRRLSSIVAIGVREFGEGAGSVRLERMRSLKVQSRLMLATLTPMALASMLRLDGSHLIFLNKEKETLEIESIAMNIVHQPSDSASTTHAPGTGRKAAAALSAAYPDAVVCKISASGGGVKVYRGGQKIT